jgi:hypothetical protein
MKGNEGVSGIFAIDVVQLKKDELMREIHHNKAMASPHIGPSNPSRKNFRIFMYLSISAIVHFIQCIWKKSAIDSRTS